MSPEMPTIPPELLPADGRFGSGPSRVRREQAATVARLWRGPLGTSHRQAPVTDLIARIRQGLHDLFHLPDGYEVALGIGGATAFWDAASFSLVRHRAAAYSCGEFGSKFATVLKQAPWLDAPDVVESTPGTAFDPLAAPPSAARADAVCFTHNETSTGVMVQVARPLPGEDQLVLVDATSAAGGLPIDVGQTDAYYFSPQKCFGSDGGMWFALLSPAALDRIAEMSRSGRYVPQFLDLATAVDKSRKNQTLNTPPIASLLLIADQIEWMLAAGGLDAMTEKTNRLASIVYSWAEQRPELCPFVQDTAARSHTVATIDVRADIDAGSVARALRAQGIVDVEPYRKLKRNQLRIGMFPTVDPADITQLTRCIDFLLDSGCVAAERQ